MNKSKKTTRKFFKPGGDNVSIFGKNTPQDDDPCFSICCLNHQSLLFVALSRQAVYMVANLSCAQITRRVYNAMVLPPLLFPIDFYLRLDDS